MSRRCVIYARISVSHEASVSIERQVEAARAYATSRGWTIVGEPFVDDGVSASATRPEDRAGWQAMLASAEPWDTVVVWKVDRMARRLTHFWRTYEQLDADGRTIVSVEDSLDMTTTIGQMLAGLLAGFAQMEAEAISARVAAAREHLIRNGRAVGGTVPYGWTTVPNPDGPGWVLVQDPDRIGWVRGMADRVLAGASVYSVCRWLDREGAPTPTGKGTEWGYSTVERILRHPILSGCIPFNPGNSSRERGEGVLLGADGLPLVHPELAVLSREDWRLLVRKLDERNTPQAKPVSQRAKTSGMLAGLVFCGDDRHDGPVRMWRGTIQGREGYYCPDCHHAISNFEHVVVAEFLRQKGERVRWTVATQVYEAGAESLPEIELRLKQLTARLTETDDEDEEASLMEAIGRLKALRREARSVPSRIDIAFEPANLFGEDWAAASSDEERRAILGDALHSITVHRGRPGRRTDAQLLGRLKFEWKVPEDLGPLEA